MKVDIKIKSNILREQDLMYHDNTHQFSKADLKQLDKHLVNLLNTYDIKKIRAALTKLNKKVG